MPKVEIFGPWQSDHSNPFYGVFCDAPGPLSGDNERTMHLTAFLGNISLLLAFFYRWLRWRDVPWPIVLPELISIALSWAQEIQKLMVSPYRFHYSWALFDGAQCVIMLLVAMNAPRCRTLRLRWVVTAFYGAFVAVFVTEYCVDLAGNRYLANLIFWKRAWLDIFNAYLLAFASILPIRRRAHGTVERTYQEAAG